MRDSPKGGGLATIEKEIFDEFVCETPSIESDPFGLRYDVEDVLWDFDLEGRGFEVEPEVFVCFFDKGVARA